MRRAPWLPFVLCLLLTAAATALVGYAERQAEHARFESAVTAARDRIDMRMASYLALLRGAAGLMSASERVRPDEFRVFVERLRLSEHYPGTLGIGYSHRFGAVSVADADQIARESGWNVRVWPETPRDDVHGIVLLEPLDRRNRAAMGFDMHSEPTRRVAMDRARDEGGAALTGKVTLVQEIEGPAQAGVLLYLPVYRGGAVPTSVEERRAKLEGFAYAPLRASDLLRGIFGHETPGVAFEVYDGTVPDTASLLDVFGTPAARRDVVQVEHLAIAGRTWTVRFVPSTLRHGLPLFAYVAILGVALSAVVLVSTRAQERARARELRAKAAAMASEEMLRFTEVFIGILGHDLKNPLNAITLSAKSLLKEHGRDEDIASTLRRIVSSSDRIARMIDQLLDLTRARLGGGISIVPASADLDAIAHDVVDEVARAQPDCRIALDAHGDLRGAWDGDRLAQVLANLVGNAARHSEKEPVDIAVSGDDPDRVVVEVHNAAAIEPSVLPFVFEPFRKGGRRAGSLGLGLYISRSIVEAHGGTIEVASAEGKGTTFTVVLPRTTAATRAEPRLRPSFHSFAPPRPAE